jgi:hypothetical protein
LQRYRSDGRAIWPTPLVLHDEGFHDDPELGVDPTGNVVLAGSYRTADNHGGMRLTKYAR